MTTTAEIIARQARERAFLATPIGLALHRFKLAHFAMAADTHNDSASFVTLKKHDDAAKAAEKALREALDAQTAQIERLRSQVCTYPACDGGCGNGYCHDVCGSRTAADTIDAQAAEIARLRAAVAHIAKRVAPSEGGRDLLQIENDYAAIRDAIRDALTEDTACTGLLSNTSSSKESTCRV